MCFDHSLGTINISKQVYREYAYTHTQLYLHRINAIEASHRMTSLCQILALLEPSLVFMRDAAIDTLQPCKSMCVCDVCMHVYMP